MGKEEREVDRERERVSLNPIPCIPLCFWMKSLSSVVGPEEEMVHSLVLFHPRPSLVESIIAGPSLFTVHTSGQTRVLS